MIHGSHLGSTTSRRHLAISLGALVLVGAAGHDAAQAAGAERQVDVEVLVNAPFGSWRRFDFEPERDDRYRTLDERATDDRLRQAVARAFTRRGYELATDGAVDFLIEIVFEAPAEPEGRGFRWSAGKQENWLEIRLRAPDDIMPLWRGRTYNVLKRKRTGRGDADALIRFIDAAEAVVDRFPPPPHPRPEPAPADAPEPDDGGDP